MSSYQAIYLVESWVNSSVYTAEVIGAVFSLQERSFPWRSKSLLLASLALGTISTCINCMNAYLFTSIVAAPPFWGILVIFAVTVISSSLNECYYTHRYWTLSKNKIMTGCMLVLIFAQTVFAFVQVISGGINIKDGHFLRDSPAIPPAILANSVLIAVANLFIFIALISVRKQLKPRYMTPNPGWFERLFILSVVYGVGPTVIGMLLVFTLLFAPEIPQFLFFTLRSAQGITLLANIVISHDSGPPSLDITWRQRGQSLPLERIHGITFTDPSFSDFRTGTQKNDGPRDGILVTRSFITTDDHVEGDHVASRGS
ncbi:hypothetical protein C8J56DRAFT_180079 [Mycena floridula]|nr:hypothetical protein C8J56DRAFT_180079 [Mycena floridula]